MTERYFRGQGRLTIATRDLGGAIDSGFRFLGNVPELTISTETEQIDHNESYTGRSLKDMEIVKKEMVNISFSLESFTKENLALVLAGSYSVIDSATVVAEPITLYTGSWNPLKNINISDFASLEIGAVTLNEGSDYTIDLKSGMIWIPANTLAVTDGDAAEATYDFGTSEKIIAMTGGRNKDYYLRFDGLNTVENNSPVILDFYKARLRSSGDIPLITDELSKLQVEGSVLFDSTRSNNDEFFSIRQLILA